MSNFDITKEFYALNNTICAALGYEASNGGYDPNGGVYEVKPDASFIRSDVIINDGPRVVIEDKAPQSNFPLLQLMVMTPKSTQYNPSFKLLNDIELIRPHIAQGIMIGDARIYRFSISQQITNGETKFSNVNESTHVGHVITIFCTAQQ